MEIQEGEEGTDSTGGKIYGGINFTALKREFKEDVQKLWRVQNWKQVIKALFHRPGFRRPWKLCRHWHRQSLCKELHQRGELHKAGDEPL